MFRDVKMEDFDTWNEYYNAAMKQCDERKDIISKMFICVAVLYIIIQIVILINI